MKKIYLFFIVASLLMTSCTKDDTAGGETLPTITISESPLGFSNAGGSKTVQMTSSGDWQVKGITDWCSISPLSGASGTYTLTVNVESSNLTEDRNTVINIGDKSFTVTQKRNGALTITQDKFSIPVEGDIIDIEVSHNVEFDIIIPYDSRGWIEEIKGKALTKSSLQFKIHASKELSKRDGMIIIKDKESELADTIKIYQAQNNHLVLVDNNQTISNQGGLFEVELRTNTIYDILIPEEADWIKLADAKSTRTDVARFAINPLDDKNDNREVVVTFKDKSSNLTDKLVLCQLADGALFLMKSKFEFDYKGGIVIVKLKEMGFTTKVIEGDDWLTPIPFDEEIASKSSEPTLRTDSIRFIANSNYTYQNKVGKILVSDKNSAATDTIKVFMKAKDVPTNTEMTKRQLWGSIGNKTASGDLTNITEYKAFYNKILLSWRMLPADTPETAFDIYRMDSGNWTKLNTAAIANSTNFQDVTANKAIDNTYKLCYAGSEVAIEEFTMSSLRTSTDNHHLIILLKETASDTRLDASTEYQANDASVGDLDGDGNYEVIIKRHAASVKEEEENNDDKDNETSATISKSPVILEAYKLDGTFLWRLIFGPNISNSNACSFIVNDFDGDGIDEIALRTSEGTYFGDGNMIGDTNGDEKTDYYEEGKYNSIAPEFLSVIKGNTGEELARTPYIAIGTSEEWGDNYFKRANSLRITAAKLKPNKICPITCRGVYDKMVLEAWEYNGPGQPMTKLWRFDTDANNGYYKRYKGQGNHQLSVADVDADGFDEVTYGACAIDHDGKGLYTTTLGHGDMLHLGDFDPKRPGLEVYQCFESGVTKAALRDARTGKQIWGTYSETPGDEGRAMIADIDPESPGCEMWTYDRVVYSIKGQPTGATGAGSVNFPIWFTGSLNRQLYDGDKIDRYNRVGGNARVFTLYRYSMESINSTKKNASFVGDIFGDWREEIITPVSGGLALNIFSTWYPTEYKFPYLMSDHVYRMSAMNENVGYNSPTQTGYYLGSDLVKP